MRVAITGGTGFVGRTLARSLVHDGHEVVLIARGVDQRDPAARELPGATFAPIGLDDPAALTRAFDGCAAVAHCAGINREIGAQTYRRVHVEGTRHIVRAASEAGVKKVSLLSFLRARPDCGSGYHESKWAAEEIVRQSGLDYTVFKAGVIYGRGDHMLDHLSHAFHTFPVFGFVGFHPQRVRPTAVEDVSKLLQTSLVDGALARQTVAVTGPEEMTLPEAVRRVARVVGRRPLMFPLPLGFHYALAWCVERLMVIPLVSTAQVRILSEGVVEPWPPCDRLPPELEPKTRFTEEQIRRGLPPPQAFGFDDLRCCHGRTAPHPRRHRAFFELP
jgi:NADH dehydrogenase